MARSFAGGTDRIAWTGLPDLSTIDASAVAFRFRTSQSGTSVQIAARWSSVSRAGWGILLNTNKLQYVVYDGTTLRVNFTGATTINDGNWHNAVALLDGRSGQTNYLYVDGNLEGSGASAFNWGNSGNPLTFGDSYDAFWGSYNGEIADVGYWRGAQPNADEIAAYNKGYSARFIRPQFMALYAPLVRDHQDRKGLAIASSGFSGTTVSDHPRVIGSMA
jgi:hypothetical protein